MKKALPYLIIAFMGIVITIETAYIFTSKKDNTKTEEKETNQEQATKEPSIKEDSVKLKRTYKLDEKILQEFEVTLNNNTKTMRISYDYAYDEETISHNILGKYNDIELYTSFLRDDYNHETNKVTPKYKKDNLYNTNSIKNYITEENFTIIKGSDEKSYLLLASVFKENDITYKKDAIYIFNDNLELISKDSITDSYACTGLDFLTTTTDSFLYHSPDVNIVTKAEGLEWYGSIPNEDNIPINILFKVEDNKIYYLALVYSEDSNPSITGKFGNIEEREYTINNNKLEYKVIKEYKVTEMANMI